MSLPSTLARYLIARENIITQIAVFYLILSSLDHSSYVPTLLDYLYNTQWFQCKSSTEAFPTESMTLLSAACTASLGRPAYPGRRALILRGWYGEHKNLH